MSKTDRGRSGQSRIGLALAGGGPEGAVYEIGALYAVSEALPDLDLNRLDVYVGVSAGAFLSANLANGLTPAQMCRAIVKSDPGEHPFVPTTFLTPATRQWLQGGLRTPSLLLDALRAYLTDPADESLLESLTRLGRALPVGFFDNRPIRNYLERIYSMKGRSNDFRALQSKLFVIAADLDSGTAIKFGSEEWDHVPISVAVQASSALPGLYPPVEIDGRHYVDGVLLKTLHASVALEEGANLLLCLNPIVPVDTSKAVTEGIMKRGKLVDRGLPTVLAQTFRTLIHSRLEVGMATYQNRFGGADVVLLEPKRDDYRMFFTNIFSFSSRRSLADHAYQRTRVELRQRFDELSPILEGHGVHLSPEALAASNGLWDKVDLQEPEARSFPRPSRVLGDLESALDRVDSILEG